MTASYTRDKIFLKAMDFYGYHGVLEAERVLGQPFQVDVTLEVDLQGAGLRDNLHETINYAQIYEEVRHIMEGEPRALLEAVAETIAATILQGYRLVNAVTVKVAKMKAPIAGHFQSMAVEIHRAINRAYIGLGSNLGEKEKNLEKALVALQYNPSILLQNYSSWYLTQPVGFTEQDAFLNGIAVVDTWLSPQELLHFLLTTEDQMGRQRKERWGPRTLDLDLLLYGKEVIDSENLIVPHERMYERAFVLVPFYEIAPNWIHPSGITTKKYLERLEDEQPTVLQVPKESIKI
ncbi:2-amino-4-hydroxy-6-hydroxymethyldihydropteridine diphosphokinase [Heliorestis convoluta]|uniref:Bifunctional folate synthesis protein n=1 Tax=Heliorestis convoluta TaxID=356322 RepID=A0A5Q2N0D5_9FIRM|nr:2-amino-4-hydroxy-6-hydroxymethyldihydropteridine diphosphokinase [Heliorestis convoluta]QGG48754.1 bifunctional dihydroneopterin aldolase/2-amino-4-hydroxy-6-hydroxymethyldihydropteridine pyrophosphokinase [Heliorestis convoluta]